MISTHYDVCIIGGGATGGILAYYVYRSGFERIPVYYFSVESVYAVDRQGGIYVIDGINGTSHLVPVIPRHYKSPFGKCQFVFNTVKAYDVPQTIELMLEITPRNGVVVMLQNGFGSLELAEQCLRGARVAGGVIYYGAQRLDRAKVLYHGGDKIIAGCRGDMCVDLMDLSKELRRGGLSLIVTSDIDLHRWLKLMLNAVVNPITAITRSPNRIVLEREALELAEAIIKEACEVAKEHGYTFEPQEVIKYVKSAVENVADNVSSMAQDVLECRPTEIDYINGFIASRLGREHSVNRILMLLVKLIERGSKL